MLFKKIFNHLIGRFNDQLLVFIFQLITSQWQWVSNGEITVVHYEQWSPVVGGWWSTIDFLNHSYLSLSPCLISTLARINEVWGKWDYRVFLRQERRITDPCAWSRKKWKSPVSSSLSPTFPPTQPPFCVCLSGCILRPSLPLCPPFSVTDITSPGKMEWIAVIFSSLFSPVPFQCHARRIKRWIPKFIWTHTARC